ncbi:FliI/YscN family ATPase [Thalassobacter stenotrophicus]|uniref:Flagellum-specific ATP synthase n=2 Tax=Thalassobacter stenotrophicus TaxID=266809 RepID=A0A0P1EXW4_9RHOB|nr:FliI/YscN family ATPase [Thalassobacter stenotrophicus]PVZ49643.1 FliI/YscN family ATPase [Thalassobacter stenotrophicus]CUH59927.1 Flagellum-specific ATP synthase [Thalassobacter stenotrophicus]SHJ17812.1 flagellum-specific ATP synthase [Thalassobacter stenotrophicus DSM 16310]
MNLTDQIMRPVGNAAGKTTLSGRVSRYDGLLLECDGFPVSVGSVCSVQTAHGVDVLGEVIGYDEGRNKLILYESGAAVQAGARVSLLDQGISVDVGDAYLGRVVDALGRPLDDQDVPKGASSVPLNGQMLNPLARALIPGALDVGVRAVNGLLTIGCGQRIGIIAGSGVGKSVLLGMMARYTSADVVVMGLIGERAREVGEMVRSIMDPAARERISIVAVPADRSPLLRIRAARRATALAEHFRDRGKNVLLIMDSLTRVAHAQREIGLALGEAPTSKGYPPSVVSMIPTLIERAGMGVGENAGSITGIYTVLADGDDDNDPVVDTARAILDGHIVLSRSIAQMGIYPAIDIPSSISRVMNDIVTPQQQAAARKFKRMVSLYNENRDLMLMGGYISGQDSDLDEAVASWPKMMSFISQSAGQSASLSESQQTLSAIVGRV